MLGQDARGNRSIIIHEFAAIITLGVSKADALDSLKSRAAQS